MTRKEEILILADRLGMTVGVLFMTVYEARYHVVPNLSNDVLLFENLCLIPDYMTEFMKEVYDAKP